MAKGNQRKYIGRFAPSPTGPLHLGSLLAAVVSYLDARANGGRWLLRIEDIDPPRQPPGSQQAIVASLEAHGLHWDGDILLQSEREAAYTAILDTLWQRGLVFRCTCSRREVGGSRYSGHCRSLGIPRDRAGAVRLRVDPETLCFDDLLQGRHCEDVSETCGDFILRRKDELWAYQLAVVVDDHYQGVTHVLRGCDLLDSTARQIYLQRLLGYETPVYGHFPVLLDAGGIKLSKQNLAPALVNERAQYNLRRILSLLHQPAPPTRLQVPADLLLWAGKHWRPAELSRLQTLRAGNETG